MQREHRLKLIYFIVLLFVLLLSMLGRNLQSFIQDNLSRTQLALLIGGLLIAMCYKAVQRLLKYQGPAHLWHLLWFLPLFILYPLSMPIVEERVHFVVFGLLGYLSLRVMLLHWAVISCVLISFGDELFQYYLPSRVGDWHDVMINLLASGAGVLFCYVSQRKAATHV